MDRRKLKTKYYMMVEQISFAPPVRASGVTWTKDSDNVVFTGTLEQILLFALQNFGVQSVAVLEKYALVDERNFQNMPSPDDISIFDLDPASGNNLLVQEEVDLVAKITDSYRRDWSEVTGSVFEEVATPTNRQYWSGARVAHLAYLVQYDAAGLDYIYNLWKWALFDKGDTKINGVTMNDLLGSQGPTLIEPAHVTLANAILNV